MKVVVVNNRYGVSAVGGAEAVAAKQVAELRAAGHDVQVVSTAPSCSRFKRGADGAWTYSPLNIWAFQKLAKLPKLLRYKWHAVDTLSPLPYFTWKKWLQQQKPDLIISHNLKGLGLTAARAFAEGPWKWEHVCHDVQLLLPSGLMMYGKEHELDAWYNRAYQHLCRKLFSGVAKVTFPSQWLLDLYRGRGFFAKAELIRMQINVKAPSAPKVRMPDCPSELLFAGQIEAHKGIPWLLENWKTVKEIIGEANLHIAGDGSLLEELMERTRGDSSVVWHGRLNRGALLHLMEGMNVLVVPSLCYENVPAVILDAYEAGLPVVASDIGGIPEVVHRGGLFRPGWVLPMARAIEAEVDN